MDVDEIDDTQEDSLKDKFLSFSLGKEIFAIEIKYVTEIIGHQEVTPVPEMQKYMRGVINLRGKVIPIMDVRLRFAMDYRDYDERTCFVVLNVGEVSIGLVVDRVSEVMEISEEKIDKKSNSVQNQAIISGLAKVEGNVIIIVNCECLISDLEFDDMKIENFNNA